MTDALAHLRAYPSGTLDPADAEAVESLIARYLDGQLETEVADQVTAAIAADEAVAAIVEEAREGRAWVKEVFAPEARRLMQGPASPGTIDLIHDLVAGKAAGSDQSSTVVPISPKATQRATGWQPWLMAASIAGLLLADGAAFYLVQARLDEASSRQLALEQQVEQLTAARDQRASRVTALDAEVDTLQDRLANAGASRAATEAELAEANRTIATLQDRRGNLEQQVATLQDALASAGDQAKRLEQQRAALAGDVDRLQAALTAAETERQQAASALEALETDRAGLQQRLAAAALEAQAAASTLSERDRELSALEQDLTAARTAASDARNQIAQLAIERRDLDAEVAALRASQRWLPQVAQYHAFYASLPSRRWAEASPEDRAKLEELLADLGQALGLKSALPLPQNLPGLSFAGGRPLPVNGMPVVQLAYVDPNGRLFAFCFMRNPDGYVKPRHPQRQGDLTLIDWSDAKFQYVVVGYGPVRALGKIAEQLQGSYRLDT